MKTKSCLAAGVLCIGSLLLEDAVAQTGSDIEPQLVCGLEVYPSPSALPVPELSPDPGSAPGPSADPCLVGTPVFGPAVFDRNDGLPEEHLVEFALSSDTDVCLISRAGELGKPFISLNGERIANPRNFNDQMDSQVHALMAGTHELAVTVFGQPGSSLEIEARAGGGGEFPGLPEPGEVQIDPLTGALDTVNADGSVRLQNLAIDHPFFSPTDTGSAVLQALTTPLVVLPGKDDGSVDYFVDWEFRIVDLTTCGLIETGLSGSEQINSPTLVVESWDGTDATNLPLPEGNYAYAFQGDIVNGDGDPFGSIMSPAFGLVIAPEPTDFNESYENLGACNPDTDPDDCRCPATHPACEFAFMPDLLPELGLPAGAVGNYLNPELIDKSFITATQDASTGRWTVVADLRNYNAGGLVPKARPTWPSEQDLRQWVSDMTGVPIDLTTESLFNFDYIQAGQSTGVDQTGLASTQFNHFLIDAMTDDIGRLRVGTNTVDLRPLINDDAGAPEAYVVSDPRAGDECDAGGNTDGVNGARTKFCAYNTAVPVGDVTDLGIYSLRTTSFDFELNNETTTQDIFCQIDPSFRCGVRTKRVLADQIEIDSIYYVETAGGAALTRSETSTITDATGLSWSADRGDGEDGVCSRAVATRDGLAVRTDSADGAVPETCVINGIF